MGAAVRGKPMHHTETIDVKPIADQKLRMNKFER